MIFTTVDSSCANRFHNKQATEGISHSDVSRAIALKTDLIPGVYEGGLKTWECSLDLAYFLMQVYSSEELKFPYLAHLHNEY